MSRSIASLIAVAALAALPAAASAAPDALWSTAAIPPNSISDGPVELGVKFRTDAPVRRILGVRAYVTGPEPSSVTLWSGGQALVTKAFTPSSGTGWQDVLFDAPVAVTPGATYIASYHAVTGYAYEHQGLADARSTKHVTALASDVDFGLGQGNGVFCYGSAPCAPTDSFDASNYWVTPLWDGTAPELGPHADVTATATSAAGAPVAYDLPAATDNVDSAPQVRCSPGPGATFAPGATTVACVATDADGNQAMSTFAVNVAFAVSGFLAPVGTGKDATAIKAGSAVPLKWQVSDGAGGFIGDTRIVDLARSGVGTCTAAARAMIASRGGKSRRGRARSRALGALRPLADYTSARSAVRYDAAAEQYVYTWQSPKQPGACYRVVVAFTDGTAREAQFTLR